MSSESDYDAKMPEGPEVFRIAQFLREKLDECILQLITIYSSGSSTTAPTALDAQVLRVVTKGKRAIIVLEGGKGILLTFALDGVLDYSEGDELDATSATTVARMLFVRSSDRMPVQVLLTDPMRIATAVLDNIKTLITQWLPKGFDPIYTTAGMREWITLCRAHPGKLVATFLTDQDYVAGVGNRYRSEIMHVADILPDSRMRDLKEYDLEILLITISRVLNAASRGEYVYVVYNRKALSNGAPVFRAEVAKGVLVWTTATAVTSARRIQHPAGTPKPVALSPAELIQASCRGGRTIASESRSRIGNSS